MCNEQGVCVSADGSTPAAMPSPPAGTPYSPSADTPKGAYAYTPWSECVLDCSAGAATDDRDGGTLAGAFSSVRGGGSEVELRLGTQTRKATCLGDCGKLDDPVLERSCLDSPCAEEACVGEPCGQDNVCEVDAANETVRIRSSLRVVGCLPASLAHVAAQVYAVHLSPAIQPF